MREPGRELGWAAAPKRHLPGVKNKNEVGKQFKAAKPAWEVGLGIARFASGFDISQALGLSSPG